MKTFVYGTALALLMSSGALAQQDNSQVRAELEKIFVEESIFVDPALLSDEVALDIYTAASGSDTDSERQIIESKLRDAGFLMVPMQQPREPGSTEMVDTTMVFEGNQLRDEVGVKLGEVGYTDVDTASLSDEQVSQIYLELQSSDMDQQKQRIDEVLGR